MSQIYSESEAAEARPEAEAGHAGEPGTLALSADDFSGLEERILRAVNLVKRERLARVAAEERAEQAEKQVAEAEQRATQAEAKLQEQQPVAEQLKSEINALRAERDQVRQRVERLLSQLDTLEL